MNLLRFALLFVKLSSLPTFAQAPEKVRSLEQIRQAKEYRDLLDASGLLKRNPDVQLKDLLVEIARDQDLAPVARVAAVDILCSWLTSYFYRNSSELFQLELIALIEEFGKDKLHSFNVAHTLARIYRSGKENAPRMFQILREGARSDNEEVRLDFIRGLRAIEHPELLAFFVESLEQTRSYALRIALIEAVASTQGADIDSAFNALRSVFMEPAQEVYIYSMVLSGLKRMEARGIQHPILQEIHRLAYGNNQELLTDRLGHHKAARQWWAQNIPLDYEGALEKLRSGTREQVNEAGEIEIRPRIDLIPHLMLIARDEDLNVIAREKAISILASWVGLLPAQTEIRSELIEALTGLLGIDRLSYHVSRHLGNMWRDSSSGGNEFIASYQAALQNEDLLGRHLLVEALLAKGDSPFVDICIKILQQDSNDRVRAAVASELHRVAENPDRVSQVVKALKDALFNPNQGLRVYRGVLHSVVSLERMGIQNEDLEIIAQALFGAEEKRDWTDVHSLSRQWWNKTRPIDYPLLLSQLAKTSTYKEANEVREILRVRSNSRYLKELQDIALNPRSSRYAVEAAMKIQADWALGVRESLEPDRQNIYASILSGLENALELIEISSHAVQSIFSIWAADFENNRIRTMIRLGFLEGPPHLREGIAVELMRSKGPWRQSREVFDWINQAMLQASPRSRAVVFENIHRFAVMHFSEVVSLLEASASQQNPKEMTLIFDSIAALGRSGLKDPRLAHVLIDGISARNPKWISSLLSAAAYYGEYPDFLKSATEALTNPKISSHAKSAATKVVARTLLLSWDDLDSLQRLSSMLALLDVLRSRETRLSASDRETARNELSRAWMLKVKPWLATQGRESEAERAAAVVFSDLERYFTENYRPKEPAQSSDTEIFVAMDMTMISGGFVSFLALLADAARERSEIWEGFPDVQVDAAQSSLANLLMPR